MKKETIIYCMDGEVIFCTNPKKKTSTKIIVNYLSQSLPGAGIKKMKINEITYYEILINSAIKIIRENSLNQYNTLENHFLNFIKAILAKTPDDLIIYLANTNYYTKDELKNIEMEFEKKQKYA